MPPSVAAERSYGEIGRLLGVPHSIGQVDPLGAGSRFCVTHAGVFYSAAWLPDAELRDPASSLGPAKLAYLAGLQLHLRGAPPFATRLDHDRAGARAAGCVLAMMGVTPGDRLVLAPRLEAATGPRANTAGWLAALTAGAEACAA